MKSKIVTCLACGKEFKEEDGCYYAPCEAACSSVCADLVLTRRSNENLRKHLASIENVLAKKVFERCGLKVRVSILENQGKN